MIRSRRGSGGGGTIASRRLNSNSPQGGPRAEWKMLLWGVADSAPYTTAGRDAPRRDPSPIAAMKGVTKRFAPARRPGRCCRSNLWRCPWRPSATPVTQLT